MIDIKSDGQVIVDRRCVGDIYLKDGSFSFVTDYRELSAEDLRAIADRLDEMNGVKNDAEV